MRMKNFAPSAAVANNLSVLVSGASSGIGEACALRLDQLGFRVFAGVRKGEDGRRLRQRASAGLMPVVLDITSSESIADVAAVVSEQVGQDGLHGLVNNAGIVVAGPIEFLPLEKIREQLEVNIIGHIAVTQAMLVSIRRAKPPGRVVNIGSVSGKLAAPFLGPYAASKFALEAFTDSLRVELSPWNIHVSIVSPGNVSTPIWSKSMQAAEEQIKHFPSEADRLYGASLRSLREYTKNASYIRKEKVVDHILHALTARNPRARYAPGLQSRLGLLLAFVPPRVEGSHCVLCLIVSRQAIDNYHSVFPPEEVMVTEKMSSNGYRSVMAVTSEQRKTVYSIRYNAYRSVDAIPPSKDKLFADEYDKMENFRSFIIYKEDVPIGSIRACLYDPSRGWNWVPAMMIFKDEIDSCFGLDVPMVESNRFCTLPGYQGDSTLSKIHYFRNIFDQSRIINANFIVTAVRSAHADFYIKLGFDVISDEKQYPALNFSTVLLAIDVQKVLQGKLSRIGSRILGLCNDSFTTTSPLC